MKGQLGKSVGEWEDSFKVLYICRGCVLDLIKTCVYGREWGISSPDNKIRRHTYQGRQDMFLICCYCVLHIFEVPSWWNFQFEQQCLISRSFKYFYFCSEQVIFNNRLFPECWCESVLKKKCGKSERNTSCQRTLMGNRRHWRHN